MKTNRKIKKYIFKEKRAKFDSAMYSMTNKKSAEGVLVKGDVNIPVK